MADALEERKDLEPGTVFAPTRWSQDPVAMTGQEPIVSQVSDLHGRDGEVGYIGRNRYFSREDVIRRKFASRLVSKRRSYTSPMHGGSASRSTRICLEARFFSVYPFIHFGWCRNLVGA